MKFQRESRQFNGNVGELVHVQEEVMKEAAEETSFLETAKSMQERVRNLRPDIPKIPPSSTTLTVPVDRHKLKRHNRLLSGNLKITSIKKPTEFTPSETKKEVHKVITPTYMTDKSKKSNLDDQSKQVGSAKQGQQPTKLRVPKAGPAINPYVTQAPSIIAMVTNSDKKPNMVSTSTQLTTEEDTNLSQKPESHPPIKTNAQQENTNKTRQIKKTMVTTTRATNSEFTMPPLVPGLPDPANTFTQLTTEEDPNPSEKPKSHPRIKTNAQQENTNKTRQIKKTMVATRATNSEITMPPLVPGLPDPANTFTQLTTEEDPNPSEKPKSHPRIKTNAQQENTNKTRQIKKTMVATRATNSEITMPPLVPGLPDPANTFTQLTTEEDPNPSEKPKSHPRIKTNAQQENTNKTRQIKNTMVATRATNSKFTMPPLVPRLPDPANTYTQLTTEEDPNPSEKPKSHPPTKPNGPEDVNTSAVGATNELLDTITKGTTQIYYRRHDAGIDARKFGPHHASNVYLPNMLLPTTAFSEVPGAEVSVLVTGPEMTTTAKISLTDPNHWENSEIESINEPSIENRPTEVKITLLEDSKTKSVTALTPIQSNAAKKKKRSYHWENHGRARRNRSNKEHYNYGRFETSGEKGTSSSATSFPITSAFSDDTTSATEPESTRQPLFSEGKIVGVSTLIQVQSESEETTLPSQSESILLRKGGHSSSAIKKQPAENESIPVKKPTSEVPVMPPADNPLTPDPVVKGLEDIKRSAKAAAMNHKEKVTSDAEMINTLKLEARRKAVVPTASSGATSSSVIPESIDEEDTLPNQRSHSGASIMVHPTENQPTTVEVTSAADPVKDGLAGLKQKVSTTKDKYEDTKKKLEEKKVIVSKWPEQLHNTSNMTTITATKIEETTTPATTRQTIPTAKNEKAEKVLERGRRSNVSPPDQPDKEITSKANTIEDEYHQFIENQKSITSPFQTPIEQRQRIVESVNLAAQDSYNASLSLILNVNPPDKISASLLTDTPTTNTTTTDSTKATMLIQKATTQLELFNTATDTTIPITEATDSTNSTTAATAFSTTTNSTTAATIKLITTEATSPLTILSTASTIQPTTKTTTTQLPSSSAISASLTETTAPISGSTQKTAAGKTRLLGGNAKGKHHKNVNFVQVNMGGSGSQKETGEVTFIPAVDSTPNNMEPTTTSYTLKLRALRQNTLLAAASRKADLEDMEEKRKKSITDREETRVKAMKEREKREENMQQARDARRTRLQKNKLERLKLADKRRMEMAIARNEREQHRIKIEASIEQRRQARRERRQERRARKKDLQQARKMKMALEEERRKEAREAAKEAMKLARIEAADLKKFRAEERREQRQWAAELRKQKEIERRRQKEEEREKLRLARREEREDRRRAQKAAEEKRRVERARRRLARKEEEERRRRDKLLDRERKRELRRELKEQKIREKEYLKEERKAELNLRRQHRQAEQAARRAEKDRERKEKYELEEEILNEKHELAKKKRIEKEEFARAKRELEERKKKIQIEDQLRKESLKNELEQAKKQEEIEEKRKEVERELRKYKVEQELEEHKIFTKEEEIELKRSAKELSKREEIERRRRKKEKEEERELRQEEKAKEWKLEALEREKEEKEEKLLNRMRRKQARKDIKEEQKERKLMIKEYKEDRKDAKHWEKKINNKHKKKKHGNKSGEKHKVGGKGKSGETVKSKENNNSGDTTESTENNKSGETEEAKEKNNLGEIEKSREKKTFGEKDDSGEEEEQLRDKENSGETVNFNKHRKQTEEHKSNQRGDEEKENPEIETNMKSKKAREKTSRQNEEPASNEEDKRNDDNDKTEPKERMGKEAADDTEDKTKAKKFLKKKEKEGENSSPLLRGEVSDAVLTEDRERAKEVREKADNSKPSSGHRRNRVRDYVGHRAKEEWDEKSRHKTLDTWR